jgi:hypothetical protein
MGFEAPLLPHCRSRCIAMVFAACPTCGIAMPLFEAEDVKVGLPSAVNALKAGKPRPVFEFKGR